MIQKDAFSWTEDAALAFKRLKDSLKSAPILALLNMDDIFTVETDASNMGIGVVLMQQGHPIAFIGRALSKLISR